MNPIGAGHLLHPPTIDGFYYEEPNALHPSYGVCTLVKDGYWAQHQIALLIFLRPGNLERLKPYIEARLMQQWEKHYEW